MLIPNTSTGNQVGYPDGVVSTFQRQPNERVNDRSLGTRYALGACRGMEHCSVYHLYTGIGALARRTIDHESPELAANAILLLAKTLLGIQIAARTHRGVLRHGPSCGCDHTEQQS